MSQSQLTVTTQKVTITEVRDVTLSDIVADGSGGFVRTVIFHGNPASGDAAVPVLEVRIAAEASENLQITTPTLTF